MTRREDEEQGALGPGGPDSGGSAPGDLGDELEPGLLPLLDAEPGPARPLSEREQLLLVDRIERQFAQRGRVLPWRPSRRVVLAGALFAASAAAAVYGVGVLTRAPGPATPADRTERRPVAPPLEESLPAEPATAEPSPGEPPPAEPPAVPAPPPGKDVKSARPAEVAAAESRSSSSGAARPTSSRATGADRLAAASALRARHRYREALALYLQVIELDPGGVQASVARVAAAEVQLDHLGDIAGAERLYREARTQGGELMAEAQFGLAQVARARGDATGERQALQEFLSRHPGSPLVSAARRRLSALGAR